MKLADILPLLVVDNSKDVAEGNRVTFVANLPHGHERPGYPCDLEDGLDVGVDHLVGQVQLHLTQVRDATAIPHLEFLPSLTPRRFLQ